MSENKGYEIKTNLISFTKEATVLFTKIVNNQNDIVNKQNEIEMLVKENSKLFRTSKTLSEYIITP